MMFVTFAKFGSTMIKRRRGWPLGAATLGGGRDGGSSPEDVKRLLSEWNKQIRNEKVAVRRRRSPTAASPVHPASLDEIEVVSRIGGVRLLKSFGRRK